MWSSTCLLFSQVLIYVVSVKAVVPTITKLDVQCAQSGMTVRVDFDNAFNGIVFSKGHFNDPSCRYVDPKIDPRSSRTSYNFVIPMASCGTLKTDGLTAGTVGFQNTIIFQNDDVVQEIWDSARKISCDWTTRFDKFVTFSPYSVDMLQVQEVAFSGDKIDCWMDLQRGKGPFATPLSGVVKIGETLTIVIYAKDEEGVFDMSVKDCYAYDGSDFNDAATRKVQLTDKDGCTVKDKLIESFYRTRDTGNTGATVIAYGFVNAFKFPEKNDVFLACNVEVCKGACAKGRCNPDAIGSSGQESIQGERVDSVIPNTILITPEPRRTIVKLLTFAPSTTRPTPRPPRLESPEPLSQVTLKSPKRLSLPQNLPKPVTVLPEPRTSTRKPLPSGPVSQRLTQAGSTPKPHHKAHALHAFHGEFGRYRTRIGGRKRREVTLDGKQNATLNFLKSFVVVSADDFPEFNQPRVGQVCLSSVNFATASAIMSATTLVAVLTAVYLYRRSKSKTFDINK